LDTNEHTNCVTIGIGGSHWLPWPSNKSIMPLWPPPIKKIFLELNGSRVGAQGKKFLACVTPAFAI